MVLIEDVRDAETYDKTAQHESDYETESESDVSVSSAADSDDDDDISPITGKPLSEETLLDRIAALQDMVAPTTRRRLGAAYGTARNWIRTGGSWAGNAVWVVTTSALLVGLPLALAIEDEARIVQQEKEIQMQQSGQQSVRNGVAE